MQGCRLGKHAWPVLTWCATQELEGCQHTLIGDEMLGMKGISGGQRRRVSGEGSRDALPGCRPTFQSSVVQADNPAACITFQVTAPPVTLQWALNW
jgi:hypothetical protein